uniref:Amino acid transporter transmembrane domain-containing protein n=2 Tax=Kalanchoe fedtschenkoi TaxID=63787 RepID=A0A7N0U9G6_KALFE
MAAERLAQPLLDEQRLGHPPRLEKVEGGDGFYRKEGASFFKTCFNGLNALSGVGIMSIPYALASGGWLSLILLFVTAMSTFYTGLLIRKCMDIDPNIRSYPDIGERAFGSKGRMLVVIVMCFELYLVATGFLILEGDNLHNLFPKMELQIADFVIGGGQFFVIIVSLIILPTVWLDNLSLLSYISASGVLASVIILCSITWTGAFEGVGFHQKGTLINWSGIPTALSLYAFCYCSHPVFPTLYTSMKNKKHQFSNVLLVCFLLCTVSYASMAVLGYMMFGADVQSQITLDLPVTKLSSKVAIYTALVNPVSKYALMVTPIVGVVENWFPSYHKSKAFNLLIRTALVASTVVVALAVPFFGSLMSLVGASLSVTASVLLPCLCYLKISGVYRRLGCEVVLISGIITLGVLVAVFGTYTSVLEIVRQW